MEVHPQARPLAKSRRVGPHRGPPTPWSTRLLATGHPHLTRPSKESPGCCWWVESKQLSRLLPASSSRDGGHINMGDACAWCSNICVWNKKGQYCWTARPCPKVWQKRTGWGCPKLLSFFWRSKSDLSGQRKKWFLVSCPFLAKKDNIFGQHKKWLYTDYFYNKSMDIQDCPKSTKIL